MNDDLTKLRARADASLGSLDRLRQQQAASGLGLRGDMVAAADRLSSYLKAAEHAAETGSLDSARRSMNHAEEELNKIEAFLNR
jgi:hypothetical protein